MGHTRAAKVTVEKLNIDQMLDMVQKSTNAGFMVPQAILLECGSRQQIAYMVDKGLIEPVTSAHGNMYRATFEVVERTMTVGNFSAIYADYVSTQEIA